jgi:lipoyl(octanoyl) transferase
MADPPRAPAVTPADLAVRDLGRMRYGEALELQRDVHAATLAARESRGPMPILLVEHDPPVITVSRRPGVAANLLADAATLARLGVEVAETDRGGDITYHGPGQLVAYPIVDLERLRFGIHEYLRRLEEAVIGTLATFGVAGRRDPGATGVWVGGEAAGETPNKTQGHRGGRKICAMGVRVSRWVTMHGLALNVAPDLSHFGLIVPCGLAGRPVTSLAAELGGQAPPFAAVRDELARRLVAALAG